MRRHLSFFQRRRVRGAFLSVRTPSTTRLTRQYPEEYFRVRRKKRGSFMVFTGAKGCGSFYLKNLNLRQYFGCVPVLNTHGLGVHALVKQSSKGRFCQNLHFVSVTTFPCGSRGWRVLWQVYSSALEYS